jgi:Pyruvate/2-oxoacid:ferredoxin oxidoreductase delta subunit
VFRCSFLTVSCSEELKKQNESKPIVSEKKTSKPAVAVVDSSSKCVDCGQWKALVEYSVSQKRKKASERRCKGCAVAENARH